MKDFDVAPRWMIQIWFFAVLTCWRAGLETEIAAHSIRILKLAVWILVVKWRHFYMWEIAFFCDVWEHIDWLSGQRFLFFLYACPHAFMVLVLLWLKRGTLMNLWEVLLALHLLLNAHFISLFGLYRLTRIILLLYVFLAFGHSYAMFLMLLNISNDYFLRYNQI